MKTTTLRRAKCAAVTAAAALALTAPAVCAEVALALFVSPGGMALRRRGRAIA